MIYKKTINSFLKGLKGKEVFKSSGIKVRFVSIIAVIFSPYNSKATIPFNNQPIEVYVTPATVQVNSLQTFSLKIILNQSINIGGGIKCRFVKGFSPIQSSDSTLAGFVTVSCSNPNSNVGVTKIVQNDPAVNWDVDNNGWILSCAVSNSSLSVGDSIFINFGASQNGKMKSPRAAFSDSILIAYDVIGNGVYNNFLINPMISTLAGPPATISAYIPSISDTMNSVKLKINIADGVGNLTVSNAEVFVECSDSIAEFPSSVIFASADSGYKVVNVKFKTAGMQCFTLKCNKIPDSLRIFKSNYTKVANNQDSINIYWGDLHSHSHASRDGIGTGSFRKAYKESCLDFYSLTDHTEGYSINSLKGGINSMEWKALKEDVKNYHQENEFITILGYEFTANSPSGHHNIFFNINDSLMDKVNIYRVDVTANIKDVWNEQSTNQPGLPFITIPHHTGIKWSPSGGPMVSFGINYGNDNFRPSIEIYSGHGESEYYNPSHPLSYENMSSFASSALGPYYAQDAWISGEYLGVIASGDDHSARPGQPYNGLAAVLCKELTRNAIFDAIRKRHTYGTTGQRMILSFKINGELMGSSVNLPIGQFPEIQIEVTGTDTLSLVEVLKWSLNQNQFNTIYSINPNSVSCLYNFIDSTFDKFGIYYLRVKQKKLIINREVWGWSSPIWVNKNVLDNTLLKKSSMNIFPNPTANALSIHFSLLEDDNIELCIYNTFGQKIKIIYSGTKLKGLNVDQLNMNYFPKGIYFLTLRGEKISSFIMKKIIKIW